MSRAAAARGTPRRSWALRARALHRAVPARAAPRGRHSGWIGVPALDGGPRQDRSGSRRARAPGSTRGPRGWPPCRPPSRARGARAAHQSVASGSPRRSPGRGSAGIRGRSIRLFAVTMKPLGRIAQGRHLLEGHVPCHSWAPSQPGTGSQAFAPCAHGNLRPACGSRCPDVRVSAKTRFWTGSTHGALRVLELVGRPGAEHGQERLERWRWGRRAGVAEREGMAAARIAQDDRAVPGHRDVDGHRLAVPRTRIVSRLVAASCQPPLVLVAPRRRPGRSARRRDPGSRPGHG